MDLDAPTVLSALITAFVGPGILLLAQNAIKKRENRDPKPPRERVERLVRVWHGKFRQKIGGQYHHVGLTATIKYNKGNLGGTLSYQFQSRSVVLDLYNLVFDGTIVKIDYRNAELGIFQYGAIVLLLNPQGDLLNGQFVGYSPSLSDVVVGQVTMCHSDLRAKGLFTSHAPQTSGLK
jgi:hypothetical protein